MKKIGMLLATVVMALGLSACIPVTHEVSVLHSPKTHSGKQCVKRCIRNKTRCDKHCGADHEQCLLQEKNKARHRYARYVKNRIKKGKKVRLTEQDFMDSEKCDVSCQCTHSYRSCYTLCGGIITKKDVCLKNCS